MTMEETIKRNLLKYQVGQQMFCPGKVCKGKVLDVRRAVSVDFFDANGDLALTKAFCTKCWDVMGEHVTEGMKAKGWKLEVFDGRAK